AIALLVDCFAQGEGSLFGEGSEGLFLLRLAGLLASGSGGRVLLLSVVAVPEGQSISAFSTTAQALRRELETLAVSALASPETVGAGLGDIPVTRSQAQTMIAPVVRVAPEHDLAGEVRRLLTEEQDLLLLLPLRRSTSDVCPWVRKALRSPLPCDVGWVRPPLPSYRPASATAPFQTGMRILIPARGGPQAQLALDLSSDLHLALQAQVTLLHVLQAMPESQRATEEAPFAELLGQMGQSQAGGMPQRAFTSGDDPVKSISEAAAQYDLLIMGAGGEAAADVGRFTQRVARDSPPALLAIKTRVPVGPAILAARRRARPHALAPEMLSLIVDKWFAENTFHADEFSDLNRLVDIKKQRGVTISVGLPALNEEATIGGVVRVLKKALMDDVPLVDEIVVIDSDSTDRTREIATGLGVPVYIHQQVLPEAGEPVPGKGEALWKSLHVLKGDIIAWVDTDVANMHPQFVYGLIGPLLREPRIGYVKGYYHRPISTSEGIQHEGGGRVTELTVRPLVNLFFPLLSGVLQPLAGEYAGRRELLEKLPFFSGYGVETGMLIDLLESYGLAAIGQVNLEKRIHRNRSLADLSLTAFAIIQVILSRLESRASITLLEEVNRSMKLIRFEDEHLSLEVRKVHDVERPPIITIPAYREARAR
ncbi:MAG TPA: glucosyl-3-phosphoglycerate synthase, partial [Chloroflexia bacterium]|nr:glucosyl-3-phosphoglycerate synthase [Chloroflexia bacterium]